MKLKLLFILFFIYPCFEFGAFGQDEEYFLPFIDSASGENLVGYKNKSGAVIIPAKYQSVFYSDTLWPLGHIKASTCEIIAIKQNNSLFFQPFICHKKPSYSDERMFRIEKNGKMGFINANNEIVISPKYDFVTYFEDEFAEFYQGVEKVYFQGCWYWGGDIKIKGYLNIEGKEFSKKTVKLYDNGNVSSVQYEWVSDNSNWQKGHEVIEYYENGNIKLHFAYATTNTGKQDFLTKYIFAESGDTVHIENRKNEVLNGEFRIGHYDYHVDSSRNKLYQWYLIRTQFSNDSILNFLNTDLVFLDEKYHEISEKIMMEKINNDNLKWTYTYLPQEVWQKSGTPITFIIHPQMQTSEDREKFDKAKATILKHWVSCEFNRLIYHSDSLSIILIDTSKSNLIIKETIVSHNNSKKFINLLFSEATYDIGLSEIPNSSIKIKSYNGDVRPTVLWVSMQSGYIYVERDYDKGYIRLKNSEKLTKEINGLLKKYDIFD